MASLGEFFTGTPQSIQQLQRFAPNQQAALSQLLQQGLGGLQQQPSFEQRAAGARKAFETQGIPQLAERLGELGGDSKYSSGFTGGLLGAQAGFEQDLLGMQEGFDERQRQNALQMLQFGLQPQFETAVQPQQLGALQSAASGLGQAGGLALMMKLLGALGGGAAGGPGGAAAGSAGAGFLSNLFGL